MNEIQNIKQVSKLNGNGKLILTPGPNVRPFLGEEMLLMDQEKNEPHHLFEALFEAENGTTLPTKLTNMPKQG